MIKRFSSMLLCLGILLSTVSLNAAAADDEVAENSVISLGDISVQSETMNEMPTVNLEEGESTISFSNVDFSKAIEVPAAITKASNEVALDSGSAENADPTALPENQVPVGTPELLVLNPESMRDGKYTTDTIFFIATRWNNTDICYDPEGGPIELVFESSIPSGYVQKLVDETYGTYAGYAIQILQPGVHPFVFAIVDRYGGMSDIYSVTFDIVTRADVQTIEGALTAATDVETYQITVDYSAVSTYYVGAMRTGTSGVKVTVLDQNGETCGTCSCYAGSGMQYVRTSTALTKPDGITGNYTYTVQVSAIDNEYVDGDAGFKVIYGSDSERQYFFEGPDNSIDLPHYDSIHETSEYLTEYSSHSYLSDVGHYYKFTATGTEDVTLTTKTGNCRFKILDGETQQLLYDGRDLGTFKPDDLSLDVVSVKINFAAGHTYYLVVYSPNMSTVQEDYYIAVGDPKFQYTSITAQIPSTYFTAGKSYTWSFSLDTPTGGDGYIDSVYYSASGAGWPYEGGYFYIKTPGVSSWRSNSPKFDVQIDYDFRNPYSVLFAANGDWQFRIDADQTGGYPGGKLRISYYYEL